MGIFLFIFPGLLLMLSWRFNRKPLSDLLIYVVSVSLSFFIILPWFIKYLHIPLTVFVYMVFICSLLLLFYWREMINLKKIKIDRADMLIIGIFLLVVLLRCSPMLFQTAPAGAEMSMHALSARLISDNDGIPTSYEPILPISNFGVSSSGFPTLSALISLLGNIPVYRSSLLLACLTHALICFGLYVLLLMFFDRNASAAVSVAATFLTRDPQLMIRWGGANILLTIFFLLMAFSLAIELKRSFSRLFIMLIVMMFAAALLTCPAGFPVSGIRLAVLYDLVAAVPFLVFLLIFYVPALSKIFEAQKKRLLIALAMIGFIYYCAFYLFNSVSQCPVTRSDMDAFRWMGAVLNKQAVIENNYGDAGIWIPAIIGMAITNPQPEVPLAKLKPSYIYVGSKAVFPVDIKHEDLEKHPRKYRRVFSNGKAQVWKILK